MSNHDQQGKAMQRNRWNWMLNKAAIALPIILVLALARCSSEAPDGGEGAVEGQQTEASAASQNSGGQSGQEQAQSESDSDPTTDQSEESDGTGYGAEAIKAAMREHIERRTRLGKPGVFEITDPRTSQTLELQFQKIHDPVRTMGGGYYFACTNFAAVGNPDKTYDLDFWLQAHDGELVVYQENVHKLPVRQDGEWVQQPRYNFVDDLPHLLR